MIVQLFAKRLVDPNLGNFETNKTKSTGLPCLSHGAAIHDFPPNWKTSKDIKIAAMYAYKDDILSKLAGNARIHHRVEIH